MFSDDDGITDDEGDYDDVVTSDGSKRHGKNYELFEYKITFLIEVYSLHLWVYLSKIK